MPSFEISIPSSFFGFFDNKWDDICNTERIKKTVMRNLD